MSDFFTNQFKQNVVVGALDLVTNPNPSVMTVLYDPTNVSTVTIVPGEGLKLIDLGANDNVGPPIVDIRTADADAIEGVLIFDQKTATKVPSDLVTVAGFGAVIWLEASAAILRGAKVSLVLASPGQIVTQTAEALLGVALDKATASGELIRVRILSQGVV